MTDVCLSILFICNILCLFWYLICFCVCLFLLCVLKHLVVANFGLRRWSYIICHTFEGSRYYPFYVMVGRLRCCCWILGCLNTY